MWFMLTTLSIWVCATVGSRFSKDADPFFIAGATTVLIGLGYFLSLTK